MSCAGRGTRSRFSRGTRLTRCAADGAGSHAHAGGGRSRFGRNACQVAQRARATRQNRINAYACGLRGIRRAFTVYMLKASAPALLHQSHDA
jgi:hypothetical protein